MKIAVFTDLYLEVTGGIPSSISAQKAELEKLGHEVIVFTPGFKSTDSSVVLLPTAKHLTINGAPLAKWPNLVVKFIEKNYPNFGQDFDLIHSHYEAGASIAASMLAKKYNLPLVQTMHGREDMAIAVNVAHPFKTFAGKGLNLIHNHYLKNITGKISVQKDNYLAPTIATKNMWELMIRQANTADEIITPSQHFADKLAHYGALKPITVVSNGVDDRIANKYKWPIRSLKNGEKLQIIWTSRLSKEKRIIPFLEALQIVKNSSNDFFFTALGDGNELELAKKFIKTHKLEDNCKIIGAVSHDKVLEYLKDQHVSIINSYGFDTQGLTILEAGVTGLPVIYCDEDMDGVLLKNAGMRAENETPEAMAALILSLIRSPEKIQQMSESAFKSREQALQSTQIKNLIKVYEKAIKK